MNTRIPARLPSLREFSDDARLIILATGLTAISFMGVHTLLRTLYVLRLGYGPAYVGIYLASGALTFMAMGMPSGALGQRFGTRRVMLAAGWITALGMAMLPMSELLKPPLRDVWPLISQIVLTVGWSGLQVNTVPALMAATHEHNRTSAYALSSALRGVGTFVGTLAGGVLPSVCAIVFGLDRSLESPTPYSYALLGGALLGLLAIVPLTRIRGGEPVPTDDETVQQRGPFPLAIVAVMIAYVFLRHMGWATCQAYCNPYMDTALDMPTTTIGALTGAGQVAAIVATLLMPALARKWHHGWIVAGSTAMLTASLALLAFTSHWSTVGLGLVGVQISAAVWLPALQVFQMETVNEGWRGLSYGAVTMAMGLGFGAMSLFGGHLIESEGYERLFSVGMGLALAGTALMAAIARRRLNS